jgi:multimeric flavodoxin WrbA
MKILVIWSSPNHDGLIAAAKNEVLAGIRESGAEAEEVCINDLHLEHCRSCGNSWGWCREKGKCIIDDEFQPLYDKILAADKVAWVTAVYFGDLTEQMKAFTDRLRRCEFAHNHSLTGKRNLLVAVAGGSGNGTLSCLQNFENTIRHMGMTAFDRLPLTRFNREYMLPAIKAAARQLKMEN